MSMQHVLERFATSDTPGAIVLRGPWGCGKTFFWNNQIVPKIQEAGKASAYVSLFGINSLQELKIAVAVTIDEFAGAATPISQGDRSWMRRALDRVAINPARAARHAPAIAEAVNLPWINAAKIVSGMAFLTVKDRVICFDDLERRGNGLDLKDVLGLISYLVEQRECRIVAILNDDALVDRRDWDHHREKVFGGEIAFTKTPNETLAIGLHDVMQRHWRPGMQASLEALSVSNIRLVRMCVNTMAQIVDMVEDQSRATPALDRIASVIPLFVWSAYGRGVGAPPLEFVTAYGHHGFVDNPYSGDQERPENHWIERLRSLPISYGEELDFAVADAVRNGYPDPDELLPAILNFTSYSNRESNRDQMRRVWKLYRDSMKDNANEIVAAAQETWPTVSDYEGASGIDGVVRLMRLVGRDDLASEYIEEWISQRLGARSDELHPASMNEFFPVRDRELIDAAAAAIRQPRNLPTLNEVFAQIAQEGHLSEQSAQVLANSSSDEIVRYWDANNTSDTMRSMRAVIKMGTIIDPPYAAAMANVIGASREMGQRSALNRDRLQRVLELRADETPQ